MTEDYTITGWIASARSAKNTQLARNGFLELPKKTTARNGVENKVAGEDQRENDQRLLRT